jgi:hypothetical protein
MAEFKEGQAVRIQVEELQPGPLDEKLVTIRTGPANLSGFVKEKFVKEHGQRCFIVGRVIGVTSESIHLKLPVSFFTSANGVAFVSRDWADNHLEAE